MNTTRVKIRICGILCLLVMLPAVPFAILAEVLQLVADGAHWVQKIVAQPFLWAVDRIERGFGQDADSLHQEWLNKIRSRP